MDPESGKIHETLREGGEPESDGGEMIRQLKKYNDLAVDARREREREIARDRARPAAQRRSDSIDDVLARAEVSGPELPPNWPRISIGERVGPIKGFWFEVLEVELASQTVVLRPIGRTGGRTGKPPRKRRKVRGGKR